jgi:hypothetical protein
MAVAERRLAADEGKLQLAAAALEQAKSRARGLEVHDVRFASEAFAQAITRRQLRYFGGQVIPVIDPAPDLAEARRLCDLAAGGTEPHSVRRWVVRQSVTNGLLSALMAFGAGMRSTQTVGSVRRLVAILESEQLAPSLASSTGGPQLYPDEISDFVWLAAVTIFERQRRSAEARRVLASWEMSKQSQSILSFERRRYELFMRLAGLDPISINGPTVTTESGGRPLNS